MKNLILCFMFCPLIVFSQNNAPAGSGVLQSIEGITSEMLKLVSGEKGEERDWEKFKELFLPEARFTVLFNRKDSAIAKTLNLEEFIQTSKKNARHSSFHEYEIGNIVEEYNGIAQVFQAYKAKSGDFEEEGINSIQLLFKEGRWWIVCVLWTSNRNGIALPERYRKGIDE